MDINTTAAKEHVGKIECMIRIIKNIYQEIVSTLSCKTLPNQFFIHMIHYAVIFLNFMLDFQVVSEHLSTMELVTGQGVDLKNHC